MRRMRDVAASVRARLQNAARERGRPFQEVLQYYAMERFLYRLAQSLDAKKFVLKGALMLTAWRASSSRPTKDIDLLARMPNDVDSVTEVIRRICGQAVDPDGLEFDTASIRGRAIKEDADYEGVRVTFLAYLQNSRVSMQIDMGFGDVIVPGATLTDYPTILDFPAPRLYGYSRETMVAEKFEAMVKLGQFNSRMKDFFDIWTLARQFDFDGSTLAKAIERTFANRETTIVAEPVALGSAFPSDAAKRMQWRSFVRKSGIDFAPLELEEVVLGLAGFLKPVAEAIVARRSFGVLWRAPGPWTRP